MAAFDTSHSWLPSATLGLDPLVHTRAKAGVLVVSYTRDCLDDPFAGEFAAICTGYAEPDGGGWTLQAVSLGMTHVVTCAGLRALVSVADSLTAAGGGLTLFSVSPDVRSVIRRTGLHERLNIARSVREAVTRARHGAPPIPFPFAPGFGLFRAA